MGLRIQPRHVWQIAGGDEQTVAGHDFTGGQLLLVGKAERLDRLPAPTQLVDDLARGDIGKPRDQVLAELDPISVLLAARFGTIDGRGLNGHRTRNPRETELLACSDAL